jgi:predicted porin
MKKSLIALAVLAAAGAVSAQTVTLSGKLRFAYEATSVTTNTAKVAVDAVVGNGSFAGTPAVAAVPVGTVDANGLRITDGDFVLTAVEDLGAGMKATASMAVQSRGRDTAVAGRDASLTVSGGFGSVLIGSIESGNGILGLGGAGSPGMYGLDGSAALAAASNVDILRYYTPAMSGFTGYVSLIDATAAVTATNFNGQTLGMDSTALTQDATQLGMTYAAGPIAAAADFTSYGLNAVAAGADSRLRVSGSYDLGVAKLGLGYEKRNMTAANTDQADLLVGVAVPMGATTFGLNYARRTGDDATKFAQAATGVDLAVKYDLSKRTYLAFAYQNVTAGAAAGVAQDTAKKYRVQLSHAF